MVSKVPIIDNRELERMHTGSLMSRRKALLSCETSRELSDREEGYIVEAGFIEFKDTDAWIEAYKDLKVVLSKREHWGKNK